MAKIKLNDLEEQLKKDFGEIIFTGNELVNFQGTVMSTLLGVDIALSGGLAEGTITTVASKAGSGKTTLILEMMAAIQQKYKKRCYFIDAEGRLRIELLKCIDGLVWNEEQEKETGIPSLKVIKSNEGNFLTAETILNIIDKIFKTEKQVIVCLDSVASLCTENLQSINLGEGQKIGSIQQLMYGLMRRIAQVLPVMRSNLILITHLQSSPNPYSPQVSYGGNAISFFSSNILNCYSSKENESDGKKIGKISTFKVLKSALGPPSQEFAINIKYGHGIEKEEDLVANAVQFGFIEKGGAWYSLNINGETKKFQGIDNITKFLKENIEFASQLETDIRQLVFGKK